MNYAFSPVAREAVGEVLEVPQEVVRSAVVTVKTLVRVLGIGFFILVYIIFVSSALYYVSDDEEVPSIFSESPAAFIDSVIPIIITFVKMDSATPKVTFRVAVDYKNLPEKFKNDDKADRLAIPFRIMISGYEYDYAFDSIPAPTDVTIPVSGTNVYYPFDGYEVAFDVAISDTQYPADFFVGSKLDLHLRIDYAMNGYICSFYESRLDAASLVEPPGIRLIKGSILRSGTFVLFPLFMLISLVGYGAVIGTVGYLVAFRPNNAVDNYRFMPAFAALLFAVPRIRADLPSGPPLGSIVDYIIYYWVQACLQSTFIILCTRQVYIFRQNVLKEKKEREAKEIEKLEKEYHDRVSRTSVSRSTLPPSVVDFIGTVEEKEDEKTPILHRDEAEEKIDFVERSIELTSLPERRSFSGGRMDEVKVSSVIANEVVDSDREIPTSGDRGRNSRDIGEEELLNPIQRSQDRKFS